MRRLTAMLTTTVSIPILASVIQGMMGWSDEEDDAQDWFATSYSENSLRLYLNSDKKNPQFLDLSFVDPSTIFIEPIISAMKGEDVSDVISNYGQGLSDPFLNTEIFTQKLLELWEGRDAYGEKIANENLPAAERYGRQMYHAGEVLIPGVFKSAKNIALGAIGYETDYGKVYDLTNEIMNSRIGIKTKSRDNKKTFSSKIKRLYHQMNATRKIYSKALTDDDIFTLKSKETRYNEAIERNKLLFKDVQNGINAMITMDYSKPEIRIALRASGASWMFINSAMQGKMLNVNKKTGRWEYTNN